MSILVFTPDSDAGRSLCSALSRAGQAARWVGDFAGAQREMRNEPPLVLVADIDAQQHGHLVSEFRAGAPWARVLLIGDATSSASADVPVIAKPFDASEVAALLEREGQLATVERSRHDLRAHLSLLVDECFEAIIGLSANGIVCSWNPGAASLYGYSAEEILGQPIALLDAIPGASHARLDQPGRHVQEVRRLHKQGHEIVVMASVSRVTRAQPGAIELAEVSLDITERRELERGLEHAERLAAIGRIAAGMAHEINNPLAVIRASAAYVAEIAARGGDSELGACASDIELAVERIGSFVQHVCGFARRERPHMTDAPIQPAIDIALRMVRPRVRDRAVTLVVEPSPELYVPHDPPRIAQAILNLLSNAADAAAGGGGHVTVRARQSDHTVIVEVDDDGPGLKPEQVKDAFEPFKTTKPFGQGTGLGLPITRQIAQDHGGRVSFSARPGGGARVTLELPRFSAGVYRLLVVDDDAQVRRALASDLRRDGFDVVTAGALHEAREVLRGGPIHVVITDLHLPDAGGNELLDALSSAVPSARLLVTSADPTSLPTSGADGVIGKPWDREQLCQQVRSLCVKGERPTGRSR